LIRVAIQSDGPTDYSWISGKMPTPANIAEKSDVGRVVTIFLGKERATQEWADAESIEEVVGDSALA
jgi:hypothetical protein